MDTGLVESKKSEVHGLKQRNVQIIEKSPDVPKDANILLWSINPDAYKLRNPDQKRAGVFFQQFLKNCGKLFMVHKTTTLRAFPKDKWFLQPL